MSATHLQSRWHALAPTVAITFAALIAFGTPAAARDAALERASFPDREHGSADRPIAPPALPADHAPAYRLGASHTDDQHDQRPALALAAPATVETVSLGGRDPLRLRPSSGCIAVLALAPKTSPPAARS